MILKLWSLRRRLASNFASRIYSEIDFSNEVVTHARKSGNSKKSKLKQSTSSKRNNQMKWFSAGHKRTDRIEGSQSERRQINFLSPQDNGISWIAIALKNAKNYAFWNIIKFISALVTSRFWINILEDNLMELKYKVSFCSEIDRPLHIYHQYWFTVLAFSFSF